MSLGMSIETFTVVHVILSLMGIVSGIRVLVGMLSASSLMAGQRFSRRHGVDERD